MIRDKHGQSEIKQYYLDHAEQVLVQEWEPWLRIPRFGEMNRLPL